MQIPIWRAQDEDEFNRSAIRWVKSEREHISRSADHETVLRLQRLLEISENHTRRRERHSR